jgi:hypothetical protein
MEGEHLDCKLLRLHPDKSIGRQVGKQGKVLVEEATAGGRDCNFVVGATMDLFHYIILYRQRMEAGEIFCDRWIRKSSYRILIVSFLHCIQRKGMGR